MKLIIRNKWITLRGSSYVRDENDTQDVMKVQGRFWSITNKKYIEDLEGNVHYMVRNKFWYIFKRRAFIYDPDKNKVATVRKKVFSFHDRYFIEDCSLGNMEIMGNILGFDYTITLDGVQVGHITRKISLRDSFVLECSDQIEPEFMVALVIAIDNITDRRRAESSSS